MMGKKITALGFVTGTIVDVVWGPDKQWEHRWYYLVKPIGLDAHWFTSDEITRIYGDEPWRR